MSDNTGILEGTDTTGSGISQDIVRVLSAYKRTLPVDFLAHVLKRSALDLEPDLALLKERHVLQTDGVNVKLV